MMPMIAFRSSSTASTTPCCCAVPKRAFAYRFPILESCCATLGLHLDLGDELFDEPAILRGIDVLAKKLLGGGEGQVDDLESKLGHYPRSLALDLVVGATNQVVGFGGGLGHQSLAKLLGFLDLSLNLLT